MSITKLTLTDFIWFFMSSRTVCMRKLNAASLSSPTIFLVFFGIFLKRLVSTGVEEADGSDDFLLLFPLKYPIL